MDRETAMKLWREAAKGAPDGVATGRALEVFAGAVEAEARDETKKKMEAVCSTLHVGLNIQARELITLRDRVRMICCEDE